MRKNISAISASALLLACLTTPSGTAADRHFGADNHEALLTFTSTVAGVASNPPSQATAIQWALEQVKYAVGSMRKASPAMALYGGEQISIQHIVASATAPGKFDVTYSYSGKVNVHNTAGATYPLTMLHTPSEAEAVGMQDCAFGQDPFWYYWDPTFQGCPLKEGQDFQTVSGDLSPLANTTETFPEYHRLFNSGVMRFDVFAGFEVYDQVDWTPAGDSSAAYLYRSLQPWLLANGYSETVWTDADIVKIYPGAPVSSDPNPWVSEFVKATSKGDIRLRFHMVNSGYAHPSSGFHYFLKDALENGSVIYYIGHSGLGKNLDLAKIESKRGFKINIPKDRYQIVLNHGCLSYWYFTRKFLDRKITGADPFGTRNLDFLSNGQEGFFEYFHYRITPFLTAIEDWTEGRKLTSYQELLKTTEIGMYSVTGDEDNERPPSF